MRVLTREVRSESTLRGLGEDELRGLGEDELRGLGKDEVPTRVVRLESTLRGRSAVEAGPAGTSLRNGTDCHSGVLREMASVVHVRHWSKDNSQTIVV